MLAKILKNSIFDEFLTALNSQRKVVFAIYIKEMQARFGHYNWGILWALLEPMAHVTVFSLLFYFKSRSSEGIEYPIFVMLGILPWLLFKNIIRRSVTAIQANRGIFCYPNVRPLDAILGRVFLEINVFIFVAFSLSLIFYFLGFHVLYENFLKFILATFLIIVMALGFGIIFAVLDSYYNAAQKILTMSFRPLYFASGIFFPISIIPEPYRGYFLYNPVMQSILLMRNAYNEDYDAAYVDPYYLAFFAFSVFAIGIFYYSLHWKNVVEK